jgi:hypothetical protein
MDKPSELWKDYIHEMRSLDKAADESFRIFIEKYAKDDKIGNPRKEKVDTQYFIIGKIYTFLYTTAERPDKARPVINRRPVILSLGQISNPTTGKTYEAGIDFMLIPPKIRIFILDQLFRFYKKDINENQDNINEGKKGKKPLKFTYEIAKKIFDKLGWQMAFCVYEKGNVKSPAVYDYEDWTSVIALYTKGITGKQPKDIYNDYIKKILSPPEVNLTDKMKTSADRKRDEIKRSKEKN